MNASSLYLDTSCLLKLFFQEPESAAVARIVADESSVIVSELCIVEASVQIHGRRLAGLFPRARAQRLEAALEQTLAMSPFEVVPFVVGAFGGARLQARAARKSAHCRTLDRLHLALMELQGLRRLLTNDERQAGAARALGFDVLTP